MSDAGDPTPSSQPAFDAIILAGGGGARLGGVSKADLVVGGRRLLDISLDAVRAARARVVVGSVAVPDGVLATQEQPPGGGPAAGLQAGLLALADHGPAGDLTVVVAVDHPGAVQAVTDLLAAVRLADAEADGWCVRQPDHRDRPAPDRRHRDRPAPDRRPRDRPAPDRRPRDRPEADLAAGDRRADAQLTWLLGVYRTSSVSNALAGDQRNRSIRSVMAELNLRPVDTTADLTDVDTPSDAAHWGLSSP